METAENFSLEKPRETVRHPGIDLLRLIAIFLICLFHADQTFRANFDTATLDFLSNAISVAIMPFGVIGNTLFVICSSYFLVDKTKSRGEKALGILFDSTLISISILVGFLLGRENLDTRTIIHQVLPDIFDMNWFVPCYVVFYLLSPVVAGGLRLLPKKAHFAFVLFGLIVYGGLETVQHAPVGSSLLQFFNVLNIVAFIKWHCPGLYTRKKTNFVVFCVGLILTYALHIASLFLAKRQILFLHFTFVSILSPILLVSLVCLFNVFKEMKFQNRIVSYLSTCSLFVYVIHENYLLRNIARVRYYEWAIGTYGMGLGLVAMLVCGLVMFLGGLLLAVCYKQTLHRLTAKFASFVAKGIGYLFNRLYGKVFKDNKAA